MLALVLSRRDFKENDQLVSLYTKEKGRVEVVARGLKKITSKNTTALLPFSLIEAEIIPGKDLHRLTRAQTILFFANIFSDLAKINIAGYAQNLVNVLLPENQKDERIFNLLSGFFYYLNQAKDLSVLLFPAFVIKLFYFLGFKPTLSHCAVCRCPLRQPKSFSYSSGGVVCQACASDLNIRPVLINANMVEIFKKILVGRWSEIASTSCPAKEMRLIQSLVYHFCLYHSVRPFSSWVKFSIVYTEYS